eukprot:TRINITY_DN4220_c0_g1_i1.p1 TRINITY_DN4220_c0_g1~~TRINITY_DN4220_c0_g1_i1.p1  ORF type:complete len:181 (-),score=37.41 TRINITY_DN4220_c0_g1_i1:595-1137(-)
MALKRKKKGMRKKKVGGSKGKYLKKFQKKKRNLITCKGQLFSHTHRDLFAVGNETSMQSLLCTPSLSPNTFTNPSFRLFLYSDAKKNSISFYDYLQYYAELSRDFFGFFFSFFSPHPTFPSILAAVEVVVVEAVAGGVMEVMAGVAGWRWRRRRGGGGGGIDSGVNSDGLFQSFFHRNTC